MIHRIVYFLLPWEIDDFQRHVDIYLASINYFKTNDDRKNVIFDITFDLSDDNLVDWDKSELSKELFRDKFMNCVNLLERYYTVEYNFGETIKGCSDARREVFNKNFDFVTWVDPDMFFSPVTLPSLYYISVQFYDMNKFFILTPSLIKYWDNSWDPLVAEKYIQESYDKFRFSFNSHSLLDTASVDDQTISALKYYDGQYLFKFFGGMFPTFSKDFYQLSQIPKELCPYGGQDTYMMHVAAIQGEKYGIVQYKIDTIVVSEDFQSANKGFGENYLKKRLSLRDSFRKRKYNVDEIVEMAKVLNE